MKALIEGAGFIRREVLALDERAMAAAYKAEPKLEQYRPYFDELRRRRQRVLGVDGERVLSLAGDNLWAEIDLNELPSDIENVFKSFRSDIVLPTLQDESGKTVQLSLSSYNKLRASSDRRVRRDAVEALLGTLRKYENTFAATLGGQMRLDVMYSKARGYDTALAAYLDKDNIDTAVYKNLISTINANLKPLHRYVSLRKKLLGVDEMHLYDLYAPIIPSARPTFPYPQALEILPQALAPLGEEYVAALKTGLDSRNGWIDVYPHKDKDSGAFSVSVFGIHPYVKMNYYDERDDLSTLAHEYGHAMHSQLSMKHQPYVTSNYVMFLAEIASTFNEKLLWDWLMEHAKTDSEKLDLLNDLVETIRTTIYRQTLFAEFELAVHTEAEKGVPLTAKRFDELYAGLIRRYYGPDFVLGPNDGMEWAYVPHFYYKYYVYAYANGLSAGIALAEQVKAGKPGAREAYLGMLKAGSSKPPLDLLRGAGVDLTKPQAILAATQLMDRLVAQIETMTAKKP
jgi:oligoendopeptidase F